MQLKTVHTQTDLAKREEVSFSGVLADPKASKRVSAIFHFSSRLAIVDTLDGTASTRFRRRMSKMVDFPDPLHFLSVSNQLSVQK